MNLVRTEATTIHADISRECSGGKNAEPKEICWYPKNEGGRCTNPVKHEDIDNENFACGVHMKRFLDEKRRAIAFAKEAKEKEERAEMAKWELGVYQAAYERLRILDETGELISDDQRPKMSSWNNRFGRTIELDIVELERWMRSYAEDSTPAEG